MPQVLALRAVLRGETLVKPNDLFACRRSRPHGHVEIVLEMMRRLGFAGLIDRRAVPERGRILALVAQRLLASIPKPTE